MKKIGVVLSGCGVFDGSEIHEATLALLYLDKAGVQVQCFAPDVAQSDVIDHASGQAAGEDRNCLTEAARIARGEIKPMSELNVDELDALILPGGFGAAKNLCSLAEDGPACKVNPEVAEAIRNAVAKAKVVGAMCIAPALVARALRDTEAHPVLTVGNDPGTAEAINAMNATHEEAGVSEIVTDEKNRIVSTPAYMLAQRISEVSEGVEKLVNKVVSMIGT